MKVQYSRGACGIRLVSVDVPDRGDREDVIHWVGQVVAGLIGTDHALRSPQCSSQKMDEVRIPMPPGTDAVGRPVKH